MPPSKLGSGIAGGVLGAAAGGLVAMLVSVTYATPRVMIGMSYGAEDTVPVLIDIVVVAISVACIVGGAALGVGALSLPDAVARKGESVDQDR